MLYSEESVKKNSFLKLLKYDQMFDSLTGLLNRNTIIGLINYSIDNKVPFSLAIMDIDNFKLINDNYGHLVGDGALKGLAQRVVEYVGDNGFVGRFGGDEYIIVNFNAYDYDSVYGFLRCFYSDCNALRMAYKVGDVAPYVTATIGAASFPKDATNYDDLFVKSDKALYRGKLKGRNCFIVYVHEKHKDLDISKKLRLDVSLAVKEIDDIFDKPVPFKERIDLMLRSIMNSIRIEGAMWIDSDLDVVASPGVYIDFKKPGNEKILTQLDETGLFILQGITKIYDDTSENSLYEEFRRVNVQALTVFKAKAYGRAEGYIVLFSTTTQRMWQVEDLAIMMHAAKLIAISIFYADDED